MINYQSDRLCPLCLNFGKEILLQEDEGVFWCIKTDCKFTENIKTFWKRRRAFVTKKRKKG